MNKVLNKKILNKIKEIYPKISKKDLILLYGSRAKGYHIKDSDIDIMIFTKNYNYFERTSIEKKLRKKNESAGFECSLENGLKLEVKIHKLKIPKIDVTFYHDILSSKPLSSKEKFKTFKIEIKKEFKKNYNKILFDSYMKFFNEQKNIEGITKRKDNLSKINLSIKKGIVTQSILRLILIIEKKPYTFDKNLSQEASKTKHWKQIVKIIKKINQIDSYEKAILSKRKAEKYINKIMPKKPYVGNWWKYLDEFKQERLI